MKRRPDSFALARAVQVAFTHKVEVDLLGRLHRGHILGIDADVRNGFGDVQVNFEVDADASREDIEALVAQSQKRSAVYDIITNPTNVSVNVSARNR